MNIKLKKTASVILAFLVVLGIGAAATPPALAGSIYQEYDPKQFTTDKHPNKTLPYQIHVPSDYDESKSYPLVLYLHGMGDRGNDNYAPLKRTNTMANQLVTAENLEKYPCIVVVPQCPVDDVWAMHFPSDISVSLDMTVELLKSIVKTYHVDQNRMYVTGFSMGGIGTWDLLLRYPDMFAAAVPIAGYAEPWAWENVRVFKDVPVRVYHGNKDEVVDVSCSRNMVNALKQAGSTRVQYFELDGVDHELAVTHAYYDEQLLPWLFSQKNNNTFPAFIPQGIKGKDFLSSSRIAASSETSSKKQTKSSNPSTTSSKRQTTETLSISSSAAELSSSQQKPVSYAAPAQSAGNQADAKEHTSSNTFFIVVCIVIVGAIGAAGIAMFIKIKINMSHAPQE